MKIEVSNLLKNYKKNQVLNIDSLTINLLDKKLISLIGQNGAGSATRFLISA